MSDIHAVSVSELTFRYGSRVALEAVSFDVPRGAVFGFLGPNGGGKTTLFSVLSTLLPVQHGRAEVLGFDLRNRAVACREQIGVTFQAPALDRRLTVFENLIHQGHLFGLTGRHLRQTAEEFLDHFGVADRKSDIVDTLSGGLKRRVELAKCLLHRPSLLLLDEPSTGLDPGARHDLWACLENLRAKDDVTVVVTTHLMDEAERCDSLGLLDQGQIVASGSPSELRSRIPGDRLTVIAERPDRMQKELREEFGVEAQRAGEALQIHHQDGQSLFQQIMDRYSEEVRSISLGKPTLEDVFMVETGHRLAENEPTAQPASADAG